MTAQTVHSYWITTSGREGFSGSIDACFPYWSFTKTVISICALKLAESGNLDLDATLKGERYTLRQLLKHTSGLPDYGQFSEYHSAVAAKETPWTRNKLLDVALAKGMLFEPVQGWSYSNIGYMFVVELIEATLEKPLREVIADMVCKPLGLNSIELAETCGQFRRVHWEAATDYDPKWVYHGCLIGNAPDAARLLHALMTGHLLQPATMRQMLDEKILGGAIPNRPWTECGYALGLMYGALKSVGRAVGHSGGGPFCVNAVYHFPDVSDPITVASFTDGTAEGVAEFAAERLAEVQ
ncbi:CubicO group peptidase, beta-lactamase class C family [Ruegeria halocynthiae]|uniref:CubicO group peptidase, beta-lactamase class C family n=1 Tax=Ruegeria halocynthiae TaxID=985054 RepID=A0A1H2UM45_9RHOB|nr:serine hydrolase domain-containing protein [Ruegeria halocynthiae]SDW57226.1 CubicO group peptidase, beta-lactamase class C family [Ruegeria halocynthiae]